MRNLEEKQENVGLCEYGKCEWGMRNGKRCEWTQREQGNRKIGNLNRNKGNVEKSKNRGKGESGKVSNRK